MTDTDSGNPHNPYHIADVPQAVKDFLAEKDLIIAGREMHQAKERLVDYAYGQDESYAPLFQSFMDFMVDCLEKYPVFLRIYCLKNKKAILNRGEYSSLLEDFTQLKAQAIQACFEAVGIWESANPKSLGEPVECRRLLEKWDVKRD